MPSGTMPTYGYRPAVGGADPAVRTRSSRRARLWAGGTYFRARDTGGAGNSISIEVLEFISEEPGQEGVKKGKIIITNHNTKYDENVVGPVTVNLLQQNLNWNERYVIDQLTTSPRALKYHVSLEATVGLSLQENLGPFAFSSLFNVPSKLSAKVTPKAAEMTPVSVITFKPRTRVYTLEVKSVTEQSEGGEQVTLTGWDIDALRTAINAGDPWVEMMDRGLASQGGAGGNSDVQDIGGDADFLTPFPDTYLTGGDGLPQSPTAERTGPTRSIVFVNYSERHDGSLGTVSKIYEWAGDTATVGEWKQY